MKAPALVASAFLLAAAPTFAQQVPAETAATNHRFEQAFNRGDAAALAALYTENATLLPPGADMMTGRQAAQTFWQGVYGSGARNLSLSTVSVESYGASFFWAITTILGSGSGSFATGPAGGVIFIGLIVFIRAGW